MKVHFLCATHRKIGFIITLLFVSLLAASAQGTSGAVVSNDPVASADLCVSVYDPTAGSTLLPGAASPNPLDPAQTAIVGLENFTITPVPEPDMVWLGSIGIALLALRFRFGEDQQS